MKALFVLLTYLVAFGSLSFGQTTDTLCSLPDGPRLFALHFADSLHGFACGRGGRVLKTTDGGWVWTHVLTPTTEELRSIACPTANQVYACSASGLLLFSHNAGQSWDTLRLGTDPLYRVVFHHANLWVTGTGKVYLNPHLDQGSFTFSVGGNWAVPDQMFWLNPQVGFLMADSLHPFTGKTVPYRTTDGGHTWQRSIRVEETGSGPNPVYRDFCWDNLHHITMRPDSTLIMCGGYYPGYVWKSTDKGLTFSVEAQVLQSNPQQVQAFNNEQVALLSWEGDALRPYIARSADGGNSWPTFFNDPSLFKLQVYFKPWGKAYFFNAQTAFIPGFTQSPLGESGAILRVSDVMAGPVTHTAGSIANPGFQLYPNPGPGSGNISSSALMPDEPMIWMDALGKTFLIHPTPGGSTHRFDATRLPSGIYRVCYRTSTLMYVKQ